MIESNPLVFLAREAWHLAIYGPYNCTVGESNPLFSLIGIKLPIKNQTVTRLFLTDRLRHIKPVKCGIVGAYLPFTRIGLGKLNPISLNLILFSGAGGI